MNNNDGPLDARNGPHAGLNEDEMILARLGYRQVFERGMSTFSSFAISFTIISILSGCLITYFLAFAHGGPAIITWGWLGVGIIVTIIGMALAEVAAAMPTAGSMYFWASKLGGPAWGWFTGWFNLVGVITVTSAIDYGAAIFWANLLHIWFGISTGPEAKFIIFTVLIVAHLVLNMQRVRLLGILNSISAWWHIAGVLIILAVLYFLPDYHRPASYIFGETINASGFPGTDFSDLGFWFVAALGLLLPMYTITGFGASAHLAEETTTAARSSAIGIVASIVISVIFGFILLVAITSVVPANIDGVLASGDDVVRYIWTQAVGPKWTAFLLFIACVAQFFCGNAALASASRMLFAFSRDGAVPGRTIWRKISDKFVPINALILCAICSWALMLPTLVNGPIGFAVGTAVAVIGLYVSFSIPIYLRWKQGDKFEHGPWSLGNHYRWICPLSFCWIWFICILFLLPTGTDSVWFTADFEWSSANYAPLTFGGLFLVVGCWWLVSARKWYTGPTREVEDEVLIQMERAETGADPKQAATP